ncbi:MAG TPA: hypothetical protein VGX78_21370 [Pirellulales bacterium]|jgi:hypothetical protein|nr:hypothetical protein [Pirellulales bacterium]
MTRASSLGKLCCPPIPDRFPKLASQEVRALSRLTARILANSATTHGGRIAPSQSGETGETGTAAKFARHALIFSGLSSRPAQFLPNKLAGYADFDDGDVGQRSRIRKNFGRNVTT